MPTPLIMGQRQIADLHSLRDRAAAAPVHMPDLVEAIKTKDGKRRHMDRMNQLTIDIPLNFLVTFSIETGHPAGTCRHMSMSTERRNATPTPEAVWMVARELGFVGGLGDGLSSCQVWLEDLQRGNGKAKAVNVVQPISVIAAANA